MKINAAIGITSCLVLMSLPAIAQPAEPPAPAPTPSTQPAPPNVVVLQPAQPVAAPPATQPGPAVYVYDMPAQPAYAYGAAPPPPPPPPQHKKRSGVRSHDGFYLRAGLGVGALALGNDKGGKGETTLSTGGGAFEFSMGGTVGEGFVLGGRVIAVGGEHLELESSEGTTDIDGSLGYGTLQLFADWYLDPESGFHIEGALGPAAVSYDPTPRDDSTNNDTTELEGVGGSIGLGLEGWVSEQWSLGGVFRLNWAALDGNLNASGPDPFSSTEDDPDASGTVIAIAPMLMFVGTFH
jgi:hypothetical protein